MILRDTELLPVYFVVRLPDYMGSTTYTAACQKY